MTNGTALPLVIDLDGTLLKTDVLHEMLLAQAICNPWLLCKIIARTKLDPAALKTTLAMHSQLDLAQLPVRQEILEIIKQAQDNKRRVILATAAAQSAATFFAKKFNITEVLATTPEHNLKGKAKLEAIQKICPEGFVYIGDHKADTPIWEQASIAHMIYDLPSTRDKLQQQKVETNIICGTQDLFTALRRAMRPHQWVKNLLIFIPLFISHSFLNLEMWAAGIMAFFSLSFMASSTYIINDLIDLPHDRIHPKKKARPLANGDLPLFKGILTVPVLILISLLLALPLGFGTAILILLYLPLSLSYSLFFKRIALMDVLLIASLFTYRIYLGTEAETLAISPWLLSFSMFLFVSLALAKRQSELLLLDKGKAEDKIAGRGYHIGDAPLIMGLGLSAGTTAIIVMLLYVALDAYPAGIYANPAFLWGLPAILFIWVGRLWLATNRGELHHDPIVFALKDKISWILGGFGFLLFALASF